MSKTKTMKGAVQINKDGPWFPISLRFYGGKVIHVDKDKDEQTLHDITEHVVAVIIRDLRSVRRFIGAGMNKNLISNYRARAALKKLHGEDGDCKGIMAAIKAANAISDSKATPEQPTAEVEQAVTTTDLDMAAWAKTEAERIDGERFGEEEDEKIKLSEKFLKYCMSRLTRRKEYLLGSNAERSLDIARDNCLLSDPLDVSARVVSQNDSANIMWKRKIELLQIDAAVLRCEEGNYGYCLGTGKKISARRLLFLPHTPYTVIHQEEIEKSSHNSMAA